MGKVSFQALIRAVSYALGVMALSGCIMEPINLKDFVDDEEVIEIIDRGAGKVFIAEGPDGPDPNLIGGNGKITILYDSEYYMVEDWGENPPLGKQEPDKVMFVAANGTCAESLTGIGRLTGKEKAITGLTNYRTYRVIPAKYLTGNVGFYDLAGLVEGSTTKMVVPIIEGAITINPPESGGYIFFTPPLPPPAPIANIDMVRVPVTPAGPTAPVSFISGDKRDIFMEADGEMEIDYVFFDRVLAALGNVEVLYALKVIITNEEPPEPPKPEELTIKVTLSDTSDNSPVLSGPEAKVTYSQDSKVPITISINNPAQFSDIRWYLDGTQIPSETGTSLLIDLNNEAVQYRLEGVYTITVIAIKDGIPYSAAIEVTVLP